MGPRLRVYLSSTYEDLKAFREAVFAGLAKAGLDIARMEDYTASDERPVDMCLRDVSESDIYVGIFAWRYGYVPPVSHDNPERRSITELEYKQAHRSGLRKLLFLAHPDTYTVWPTKFRDELTGQSDAGTFIRMLRDSLGTEKVASFFRTPDELATLVLAAILRSGLTDQRQHVPMPQAGYVVRRERAQAVNASLLGSPSPPDQHGTHVLVHGPGGFGKTELVKHVCNQPDFVGAFPAGIFWIVLGEAADIIETALNDLHAAVTGKISTRTGIDALVRSISAAIGDRVCLVVVDDVWRAEDLQPLLNIRNARLLVTSRLPHLAEDLGSDEWKDIAVDEMQPSEAEALLSRGLATHEAEHGALLALSERLGRWPLLLGLAHARLLEERKSRQGNLSDSLERITQLLDQRGVLGFDRRDSRARSSAVTRSLGVGLDFADELHLGTKRKALELSIFPAGARVPVSVLAGLWHADPFDIEEDVLRILSRLSIIDWNRDEGVVQLHDLIRQALAADLGEGAMTVHESLLSSWGDPHGLPHAYAWQWICWHLLRAGKPSEARRLLLDVTWLEGKVRHVGLIPLLQDLDRLRDDPILSQIRAAVLLATSILASHPQQLAQQLEFRMAPDAWRQLRADVAHAVALNLRPRSPSLAQTGGAVARLFSLSEQSVTCVDRLDDHRLLFGCVGKGLVAFDLDTGEQQRLGTLEEAPQVMTVSRDGRALACASDRPSNIALQTDGVWRDAVVSHPGAVHALALGNDGRVLVSVDREGAVRAWDASSGCQTWSMEAIASVRREVLCQPNGNGLVVVESSYADGMPARVRVLDINTGAESGQLMLPGQGVARFALSSSGRLFACAFNFVQVMNVAIVDLEHCSLVDTLELDPGKNIQMIRALAFCDGECSLLAGTSGGEIIICDLTTREVPARAAAHHNQVAWLGQMDQHVVSVGWSESARLRDQTMDECNVKVWSGSMNDLRRYISTRPAVSKHKSDVSAVSLCGDGAHLVAGSYDRTVSIWDAKAMERRHQLPIRGVVCAVCCDESARRCGALANYHMDSGVVTVWSLDSGEQLLHFETTDLGKSLALAEDDNLLLVGMMTDLEARSLVDGSMVRSMCIGGKSQADYHTGASCRLPGQRIALGFESGDIKIWNYASGQKEHEFTAHDGAVTALSTCSAHATLISAGMDRSLAFWSIADGSPRDRVNDIDHQVKALTGSAREALFLTAASDGGVRLWRLFGRQPAATFLLDSPLSACALSDDCRTVCLGDVSGEVHFLEVNGL